MDNVLSQKSLNNSEFKYWAFISYSHRDKKWGDWLHKALETYKIPKHIVGKPCRDGIVPERIFPIFRDREELPTSHDLGKNINAALEQSKYLIVICSPYSAKSQWVAAEIKYFKSLGRENRVLCLIVDGEPNAADKSDLGLEECFPEAVKFQVDSSGNQTEIPTEPIAADARKGKDDKNNAKLKVLAGLLGVGFDELKQRDLQRKQKQMSIYLSISLLIVLVMTALMVYAFIARREAVKNEQVAITQKERAVKAEKEAKDQRNIAQDRLNKLLYEKMKELKALAFTELESGNRDKALELTLEALEISEQLGVTLKESEVLLFRSLDNQNLIHTLKKHKAPIDFIETDKNKTRMVSIAENEIFLWDTDDWSMVSKIDSGGGPWACFSSDGQTLVTVSTAGGNDDDPIQIIVGLWKGKTGQLIKTYTLPAGWYRKTSRKSFYQGLIGLDNYLPDEGKGLIIYDLINETLKLQIPMSENAHNRLAFTHDGLKAIVSTEKSINSYSITNQKKISSMENVFSIMQGLNISPDNTMLSGYDNNQFKLWRLDTGKRVYEGERKRGQRYSFSSGSRYLYVSGDYSSTGIDCQTGEDFESGRSFDLIVQGETFHAYSNNGYMSFVWDSLPFTFSVHPHDGGIRTMTLMPDQKLLVSGGKDHLIKIWSTTPTIGKSIIQRYQPEGIVFQGYKGLLYMPDYRLNETVFSEECQKLLTWPDQDHAQVWDLKTKTMQTQVTGFKDNYVDYIWAPEKERLITVSRNKQLPVFKLSNDKTPWPDATVRFWNTQEKQGQMSKKIAGLLNIKISPDKEKAIFYYSDQDPELWDLQTMTKMASFDSGKESQIVFNHKGNLLAIADSNKMELTLWDLKKGGVIFNEKQGQKEDLFDRISQFAFSPDDSLVAAQTLKQGLKVLNLEDKKWTQIKHMDTDIEEIAFSPDNKILLFRSPSKLTAVELPSGKLKYERFGQFNFKQSFFVEEQNRAYLLVDVYGDKQTFVINYLNGRGLKSFDGHFELLSKKDSLTARIISNGAFDSLGLYDLDTLELLWRTGLAEPITDTGYNESNKTVYFSTRTGVFMLPVLRDLADLKADAQKKKKQTKDTTKPENKTAP